MSERNESAELGQVFPGAAVDLYGGAELAALLAENAQNQAPPDAPESPQDPQAPTTSPDQLAALAAQAAAERRGVTWETAQLAAASTKEFFNKFTPGLEVPELAELKAAGVDFEHLEAGFEAYEGASMEPMLVIAPVNLPLDKWRETYAALQEWQSETYPKPPQDQPDPLQGRRLQDRQDGNGLYINPTVEPAWEELNQQAVDETPGASFTAADGTVWKVLVVPAAPREQNGLAVNTSHDLSTQNLGSQEATLQVDPDQINQKNAHMPIGTYLTLQASALRHDDTPIDSNTWTWNAGTFTSGVLQAPASFWLSDAGQVYVRYGDVDYSDGDIGVRLPVWG